MRPRYRVKRVYDGRLKDYGGMHRLIAKQLHFPMPRGADIVIDAQRPQREQRRTIIHEKTELRLMRKGLPYWPAHKAALKAEHKR
jgi:predicted kinase